MGLVFDLTDSESCQGAQRKAGAEGGGVSMVITTEESSI